MTSRLSSHSGDARPGRRTGARRQGSRTAADAASRRAVAGALAGPAPSRLPDPAAGGADGSGIASRTGPASLAARASSLATATVLVLALGSGPAALAVALSRPTAPPAAAADAAPPDGPADEAVAAGGVASDFVATWLSAAEDDTGSLASYVDPSSVALPVTPAQVVRAEPVQLSAVHPGRWRVVVRTELRTPVPAGTPESGGPAQPASAPASQAVPAAGSFVTRYFEVGIDTSTTVRPLGPPAAVAAPDLAALPPSRGTELDPTTPVSLSVVRFLDAMLTGEGDLTPWTAPGSSLAAVVPAPYVEVSDVQVWALDDDVPVAASDSQVSVADGTRLTVQVAARVRVATPGAAAGDGAQAAEPVAAGSRELAVGYELTVAARAGRWEVASLAPAGLTAAGRVPAAAPTSTSTAAPTSTPSQTTPTQPPASAAPVPVGTDPQPTSEGTLP